MDFLRFLESLRTPFFNSFFSVITHFGEETLFIVIGLVFFWCINKREGYYLLSIGFIGTVLNQFLKLWFRIPRPWVKDSNFTIVESARNEATGYSFPSGHTQSSVGIFGGLARWNSQKAVRIICIILCVLVPFSRLYLGVHTPLDVAVSIVIALSLVFGLYPIIKNTANSDKGIRVLLIIMTLLASLLLAFVSFYKFPNDVDTVNLKNGTENAYKMLGCTLGIWLAFEIDQRFIKFETSAVFKAQILKLLIGVILVLAIKEGLRSPLNLLFAGHFIADGIRYFLIVAFAGCVWPLTFRYFSKLFKH